MILKGMFSRIARWMTADGNESVITYKRNRNSSDTAEQTDSTMTVLSYTAVNTAASGNFTKPYYDFSGWNTAADGSGTWYDEGDTLEESTTLYAIWEDNTPVYTVRGSELGIIADAIYDKGVFKNLLESDNTVPNVMYNEYYTISGVYEEGSPEDSAPYNLPIWIHKIGGSYSIFMPTTSEPVAPGGRFSYTLQIDNMTVNKLKVEVATGHVTQLQVEKGSTMTDYVPHALIFPDMFAEAVSGIEKNVWVHERGLFPNMNTSISARTMSLIGTIRMDYSDALRIRGFVCPEGVYVRMYKNTALNKYQIEIHYRNSGNSEITLNTNAVTIEFDYSY